MTATNLPKEGERIDMQVKIPAQISGLMEISANNISWVLNKTLLLKGYLAISFGYLKVQAAEEDLKKNQYFYYFMDIRSLEDCFQLSKTLHEPLRAHATDLVREKVEKDIALKVGWKLKEKDAESRRLWKSRFDTIKGILSIELAGLNFEEVNRIEKKLLYSCYMKIKTSESFYTVREKYLKYGVDILDIIKTTSFLNPSPVAKTH